VKTCLLKPAVKNIAPPFLGKLEHF